MRTDKKIVSNTLKSEHGIKVEVIGKDVLRGTRINILVMKTARVVFPEF